MTIESHREHISSFVIWVISAASFPSIIGICVYMRSTADYHDGHDGDANGDGDGMASTQSSRLDTSTSKSHL